MTPLVLGLVCGIGAFIIGIAVMTAIQRSSAKSKAKTIIEEAQKEADMLMQEKLLKAREEEHKSRSRQGRQPAHGKSAAE